VLVCSNGFLWLVNLLQSKPEEIQNACFSVSVSEVTGSCEGAMGKGNLVIEVPTPMEEARHREGQAYCNARMADRRSIYGSRKVRVLGVQPPEGSLPIWEAVRRRSLNCRIEMIVGGFSGT
jgi:hypothetical protein